MSSLRRALRRLLPWCRAIDDRDETIRELADAVIRLLPNSYLVIDRFATSDERIALMRGIDRIEEMIKPYSDHTCTCNHAGPYGTDGDRRDG